MRAIKIQLMHVVFYNTLIRNIKSGKATIPELTTLFHYLLDQKFSDREQLFVCRTLAQRQHAYAIAGDPRLKGWAFNIETALEQVDQNIAYAISSILTVHPQSKKSAYTSKHGETDLLTIALYKIFFGQAPDLSIELLPEEKKTILLRMISKSNLGLILGVGVVFMTITWLIWASFVTPDVNAKLCLENSTSVHDRNFLSLSDGSEIILAANSTVCYAQPVYSNGRREVGLQEGSAYFEINPDAKHPFFIRTPGGVVTEVRGTGLNINIDKEQQLVSIAVAHGIVIVHYNGEITEVPPGQQMSIALLTHETHIENFDSSNVPWPYPSVNFERATLETIAKEIEDRFHVSVVFKNDVLKGIKITAGFEGDNFQLKRIVESLNMALMAENINLTLTGNTIIVNKKGVSEEVPALPLPQK
jgi:ferric-dicitrate binding protein FerR (iron transport regulator)